MLRPKKALIGGDSSKLINLLKFCLLEAWPLLIILLALGIELAHIATSQWATLYLYNGDSLTMVLLRQSLAHKEPFLWIFSSQFNFFPEGPLYAISSFLAHSVRASLAMNSAVNIVLFYGLFRIIAGLIYPGKRLASQFVAVLATLIFIAEMLLERKPAVDQNTIATLFLFNTYFYGIILSGLATLAICVSLIQRKAIGLMSNFWLYALGFLISGLTTFSNPLFIFQFEIPFIIVLLILKLFKVFNFKKVFCLFIATSGTIFGYFLRQPFKDFVGSTPTSHINFKDIHPAISLLSGSIKIDLHSLSGELELALGIFVILIGLYFAGYRLIYKRTLHSNLYYSQLLFVSLFGIMSAAVCIIFVIATGQVTTRYLLPIYAFPLLSVLWLLSIKGLRKYYKLSLISACILFASFALVGLTHINDAKKLLSTSAPGSSCLEKSLDYLPANGVASYTTSRVLDVYALFDERTLQINGGGDGLIYPMLANLGAYKNKQFSFIVIDKPSSAGSGWGSYTGTISNLGYPSSIKSCSAFWVFIYKPSNPGNKILNREIQQNYNHIYLLRQSGSVASFFSNP